ncbi:S26 family signal peptidase [Mesorhizobium sp. M1169]
MVGGAVLAAAPAWISHPPLSIWNASASIPVGLYRVQPADKIGIANIAVIMPPEPLAAFMARRGYLPKKVPLLKRVLALGGATVCRQGTMIIVNGKTYGHARERDSRGRSLPIWQGCRDVAEADVFLMNPGAADSFDSRYFGPLPLSSIVGRAVPVWTTERTTPVLDITNDPSLASRDGSARRAPTLRKEHCNDPDRNLHAQ